MDLFDEFQETILGHKKYLDKILERLTNIDHVLLALEERDAEDNPIIIVHPKYQETLPKKPQSVDSSDDEFSIANSSTVQKSSKNSYQNFKSSDLSKMKKKGVSPVYQEKQSKAFLQKKNTLTPCRNFVLKL